MEIQDILKKIKNTTRPSEEILLVRAIEKAIKDYDCEISFLIEKPKEESYGDYSTNVAMVLAGTLKRNPLEIAQEIVGKIDKSNFLESVDAIVPGFINFKIKKEFFLKELQKILAEKGNYGKLEKNSKKTMVEFGQPNTHKAFHIGHLKSAISGLSVCKLIENLGCEVIKTNYYGDIGMHTAKSTWGVMQKDLPEDFDTWDKHKRMKYIDDAYVFASENFDENEIEIREINRDIYNKNKTEATQLHKKIKVWSLKHLDAIFSDLGVVYDKQYPESQVYEEAIRIVKENIGNIFEESQGAIIYSGEKDGLVTWVMQTKEGIPTYSAKDIALGFQKFRDYPDLDLNITLTSVEQKDYFQAIIKILEKLDGKFKNRYFHIPFGWMLREGKKTSSRMGGSIKGVDILKEALEEAKTKIAELKNYDKEKREEIARVVALAGLKFLILSHEFHKNINYDPKKFIDFEGYSGPYILYAYVRAKSILQKSKNLGIAFPSNWKMNEFEKKLLKWLVRYPQTAYRAGTEIAPHLLCNYLYELAQRFNSFYANCPVIKASEEEKGIRLALSEGTAQVLKNGLGLLGIETIEEM